MRIRNNSSDYWDEHYTSDTITPKYDDWLKKYSERLELSRHTPIIDLGCGAGNNALYLSQMGYDVIACDYSNEALDKVKAFAPDVKTIRLDMTEGLNFQDDSAFVVIADLSLHYFKEETTAFILKEIDRILKLDGLLLIRVNSIRDVHYGAGQGNAIEQGFYFNAGRYKRFFDEKMIDRFFSDWYIDYIREYELNRYAMPKVVWELALTKRKKL